MNENLIYARCQCDFYNVIELQKYLTQNHDLKMIRNVMQLNWHGGEAFIFAYGVCVFWRVSEDNRNDLLELLNGFSENLIEVLLDDEFTYTLSSIKASIKNDNISLNDNDISIRLALSHGIAQSTKLLQYEARVQNTITSTEYIPNKIASTGKSGLRRKELAKLRGQLYLTKSDVMLHYDLLDVPNYFWENPELQQYYVLTAEYLETKPRINVLNKKLETIQDLLSMIGDEQKHTHSSLLEWIIIWLIALDITIILLQEYFFKI